MSDQTYKFPNVLIQIFSGLCLVEDLLAFFRRNPELQSLEIQGETQWDDGDLCKTVDCFRFNMGKWYSDNEEVEEPWYNKDVEDALDVCTDMLCIIADGEEMEGIEVLITRDDIEKMRFLLEMGNFIRKSITEVISEE